MSIPKWSNYTSKLLSTFPRRLALADIEPASDTIKQDKAAVLVYLRMKHKNPNQGYVLCGIVSIASLFDLREFTDISGFFSPGQHQNHTHSEAQVLTLAF